ncbi:MULTISPECIES: type II toxin-antitoxin system RelE/ParE family toxin [Aphanizomenonaceae]|jgi:plasmid stabilization system protein ParE|uniref:Type II toxin-antitoxin system RelE/ParE family toxin n=1 Tax=Dolichospermum heterosporum TAC447 TaxID=747523 RepID=A0ABY5LRK0_9CYAN|nr:MULTISPECIES: type II toxin-antitoxin system RelE/ParE family toxin [Aphanizomenonaceae]UUO13367.1 type II toxin-antitoxin system RelE/ParE family toxin [Dolichospermum heterosporum TAC447]
MSEIVWTETATNDLNRHYDFIALSNADAAVRAVQAIVSSGEVYNKILVAVGL